MRTKWRRRVLLGTTGTVVVVALALGAAGYYYSGLVIDPVHTSNYPIEVTAVGEGQVTLKGGGDTDAPGTYGLTWAGGNAVLGEAISVGAGTVTREVEKVRSGDLRPGVSAYLDRWMWGAGTPESVGVPYKEVGVESPLGVFPAWRTEGTSDTWVIAVHGRNGGRGEALRILPTLHDLGHPVLAITYRNDEGAPASPDGRFHLGDTEWEDVRAAMDYARGQGAKKFVLYGWSMGGGISAMTARRLPGAGVTALILDSPVLDWRSPIALGARQMGVPGFLTTVGQWVIMARTGLSFDDLDHVEHAAEFDLPILIFVDHDDATVPVDRAQAFARARPDLTTLVETKGGGHTGSWNVDPDAYERAVRDFLRSPR
ncbi:alpha/beta fold hydrolase [Herbidospora sp. NBRC 101105]|uniref:alpha/beta hydrolase n=1 Tax=Herbidospora sp. NBRC 101105 TaxID=3032195 RepID=UPI00255316F1|nr:alpha/beta fold hydrolase [Herbidospora sp. NBRC 101105]